MNTFNMEFTVSLHFTLNSRDFDIISPCLFPIEVYIAWNFYHVNVIGAILFEHKIYSFYVKFSWRDFERVY